MHDTAPTPRHGSDHWMESMVESHRLGWLTEPADKKKKPQSHSIQQGEP